MIKLSTLFLAFTIEVAQCKLLEHPTIDVSTSEVGARVSRAFGLKWSKRREHDNRATLLALVSPTTTALGVALLQLKQGKRGERRLKQTRDL